MLSYLHVTGRTLIMGDLHGCYQQLLTRLSRLDFAPEQGDRLIALGDLTDRGADNLACLRLLRQPWFHSIRGNHEQLMLLALLGVASGLLVTFIVYGALRTMAARRLKGNHG